MKVVVAANGHYAHVERLLPLLDAADLVLAADGGANWLASQGIVPAILVGDLDSISPHVLRDLERGACRISRHPTNKDETDTELALIEAVATGATRISLIGALGGRIDHELANILLLLMPQLDGIETTIFDGTSFLSVVRHERVLDGEPGDTLSLIPLGGEVSGIVTEGLEYPLCDEVLYVGPARGVSNVFTAPRARVSCCAGTLLAVHTPCRNIPKGGR